MGNIITEHMSVVAGIVLAAVVAVFLFAAGALANNTANKMADENVQMTQELADDIVTRFDNKETTGAQIIELIDKAQNDDVCITVEKIVVEENGDGTKTYRSEWQKYVKTDATLSDSTDSDAAHLMKRARNNIPEDNVYKGKKDLNSQGDVIGVTFSKVR